MRTRSRARYNREPGPESGSRAIIRKHEGSVTFRFTTAGESHGRGLVAVLEGIPAGLPLSADRINAELQRRMGGYGPGARMKIEAGQIEGAARGRGGGRPGGPPPAGGGERGA